MQYMIAHKERHSDHSSDHSFDQDRNQDIFETEKEELVFITIVEFRYDQADCLLEARQRLLFASSSLFWYETRLICTCREETS